MLDACRDGEVGTELSTPLVNFMEKLQEEDMCKINIKYGPQFCAFPFGIKIHNVRAAV